MARQIKRFNEYENMEEFIREAPQEAKHVARIALVIFSILFGIVTLFLLMWVSCEKGHITEACYPYPIYYGFAAMFLYPIMGAAALRLALWLRRGAYEKAERTEWERERKVFWVAVWPATLLYALLVYPLLFTIRFLIP